MTDPIREAFIAGYDAGWESTGEGKNAEYTSSRYTQAAYETERADAYAAFARAPDPDEVKRQVEALAEWLAARTEEAPLNDDATRLATLAYELGARVR